MDLETLVKKTFGIDAEIISKTEMEKGASSRRYFRIELKGLTAPSTAVVMQLPKDPMVSDEVQSLETSEELSFVNIQRFMTDSQLRVPKIYLNAADEECLILEDLGNETLNSKIKTCSAKEIEQWYLAAVDLLSKMHRNMQPLNENCFASKRYFDRDLLRWELDHYLKWGLYEYKGLKSLDERIVDELNEAFDELADEIASLPFGFVHRDYQSRNLMVTPGKISKNNLAIIDFQDAMTGPRVYDLVALLNDSYVDLPGDVQKRLIDRYTTRMNLSRSEVQYEFDLITVQRKLKDGGRFVFIDREKGDPSFLPFVEKSFSRVARVLWRLPGHSQLKNALVKIDPENFSKPEH
ncbi:MAG: phosphotransferase [Deltaproteobacteria bacterium]|nr:phosphotransferase [Deltaproteobacteria bacterium]